MSEIDAQIRVLIVATNPLARIGLVSLLADACMVVADVADDGELLAHAEEHQPDVILWDFGWDTSVALESLSDLSGSLLLPPVVVLLADSADVIEAQAAGANGILSQNSTAEQILAALMAVQHGLFVIDSEMNLPPVIDADIDPPSEALTPREIEVLQLLAEGLSNKMIAARLAVSEHTVKFHVNAILGKLGAQSRTEAVVRATRMGLIIL
jgi:DNA-binding NarL/FixJ family response regulator